MVEVPLDDVLAFAVLMVQVPWSRPATKIASEVKRAGELHLGGREEMPVVGRERLGPLSLLFAVLELARLEHLAVNVVERALALVDVVAGGVLGNLPLHLDLSVGITAS